MNKIPIADIIIGERQRIELGDLTDLDSIGDPEVGMIQPVVLDDKNLLVDGRRRIAKASALGWTEIPFVRKGTLTNVQKQKMEFLADVARKDRTWQEKCIAVYQIHDLLTLEKAADGEKWTIRAMATFTGYEKSNMHYMLQVGKALLVQPKDEELWKTDGYTSAIKVLIGRHEKEVREELERRRNQARATQIVESVESEPDPETPSPSDVQESDTTEKPIRVIIHGHNEPLPNEPGYRAALAFEPDVQTLKKLLNCLHPTEGIAVVWSQLFDYLHAEEIGFACEGPLVWNRISTPDEHDWPFYPNMLFGWCLAKADAPVERAFKPQPGVISAHVEDDGSLPLALIDYSTSFLPENQAVLCLGGHFAHLVVELGKVPVFYEPDPERYNEAIVKVRATYERLIPNCQVVLRSEL